MAPDGSRAAIASHDGRVLLVERETGEVREIDRSEDGDVSGLVFSPDSGWLAWSHPGPRPLSQIKLANTTDLSVTEATRCASRTTRPPSPSTASIPSCSTRSFSTRSTTSTSSTSPSSRASGRT
ncbi:Tricorn protease OS=Streptomyces albaduncus OX=68172 GN=FHS32_000458 PE=3 SV=1 [Streptomyces griseoloalbus]